MSNHIQARETQTQLFLYKERRALDLLALLSFAAILCLSRWRAIPDLASKFFSGAEGDAGLYIWIVKRNLSFLSNQWFETNAFYPYSYSLAFTDNFVLPSLAAKLLIAVGAPLPLAMNLVILGANLLNGFVTYRLCSKLTGNFRAAFICGLAFMLFPFIVAHYVHTQLQFAFFIPLAISLFLEFLAKPGFAAGVKVGLCVFLAFITTVYYAVFIALLVPTLLGAFCLIRPDGFRAKTALLALGGAVGALPALPFVWPYLEVKRAFGPRGVFESFYLSATGISYLAAPDINILYGGLLGGLQEIFLGLHFEATLFPGFLVFGLAALGMRTIFDGSRLRASGTLAALLLGGAFLFSFLYFPSSFNLPLGSNRYVAAALLWAGILAGARHLWLLGRFEADLGQERFTDRAVVAVFVFIFIIFACLSFGPLGNPDRINQPTRWFGFFRPFYLFFPGFDGIRAVGRAGIPAILSLIVVAAFGLRTLFERAAGGIAVFLAIFVGLLAETAVGSWAPQAESAAPPAVGSLQRESKPGDAAIFLPMAPNAVGQGGNIIDTVSSYAILQVNYMLWTADRDIRIVNGYSGISTRIFKSFPKLLRGFPDEKSLAELLSIVGLKHVVYCPGLDQSFDAERFAAGLKSFSANLSLVEKDSAGCMLFKLGGKFEARPGQYLKMPGRSEGIVSVELSAVGSEAKDLTVSAVVPQEAGKPPRPVAEAKLRADGSWRRVEFRIPAASARGQLSYVGFASSSAARIFVRAVEFRAESQ